MSIVRGRNSKGAWSALVNVAVEPDGLVRRYSFGETLDGQFVPSVGALLAGKYDSDGPPLRIDFSIRADSLPTISYVDVLHGDPTAMQKLKGKKVIIGGTAIELGDRFSVPNGRIIPGPLLQMLAAESILQDRVLRPISGYGVRARLLALLMPLMWRRAPLRLRVAVLVVVAVAAEAAATLLQAKFAIILEPRSGISPSAPISSPWRSTKSISAALLRRRRRTPLPADRDVARRRARLRRPERPDHGLESRRLRSSAIGDEEMIGQPLDAICA